MEVGFRYHLEVEFSLLPVGRVPCSWRERRFEPGIVEGKRQQFRQKQYQHMHITVRANEKRNDGNS